MRISVSLVEDDRGTRERLVDVLNSSTRVRCLDAYASAEEALARLPGSAPDVVLMDINLSGMSGIECVARLKSLLPAVEVLMLTTYEDSELIFDSICAGASGYLLKNLPPQKLIEAVEEVRAGGAPMSIPIARKVLSYFRKDRAVSGELATLTAREQEILGLLAKGYADKEIGARLNISLSTVHVHLHNIYGKLHVRSRTEAVVKFLRT